MLIITKSMLTVTDYTVDKPLIITKSTLCFSNYNKKYDVR